MDSIYLVSKNKKYTAFELITIILKTIIKFKYLLSVVSYNENSEFPLFKIEKKESHLNEEGKSVNPNIWVSFFRDSNLYQTDNNFPIFCKGNYYYPVVSFQCRESLFLLELLTQIVSSNENFMICNVENKLMGYDELEKNLRNKNYGWGYLE